MVFMCLMPSWVSPIVSLIVIVLMGSTSAALGTHRDRRTRELARSRDSGQQSKFKMVA